MTKQRYRVVPGPFDRFIIVHPASDFWAWSGSRWVGTVGGVPTEGVQLCNFSSEAEAREYAERNVGLLGAMPGRELAAC